MDKSKTGVLIGVIVLLTGIISGLLLDRVFFYPRFSRKTFRGSGYHEKHKDRLVNKFCKKLDLTSEQREKLCAIMDKHRKSMQALRKEMDPKFDNMKEALKKEINLILNDEQKKKFEELHKKLEEKRKRRGIKWEKGRCLSK